MPCEDGNWDVHDWRNQVTGATQYHGKINLVINSTALKVYGEGEWKLKKHGDVVVRCLKRPGTG